MDQNDIGVPRKVRSFLYVLLVIGSPIVGYLAIAQPEWVGPNEVALWSALTAAVALIARLNLTPPSKP